MNVAQAAEVLGCSPGTVKTQTAKGLDALRRALQPTETAPSTGLRQVLSRGPRSTRKEVGEQG
jgi:hypothetical protein